MDTSTIVAFLVLLILLIIINEIWEAIPLMIIGFVVGGITINLSTIFSITSSGLLGWGNVVTMAYALASVYAFAKCGTSGITIFGGKAKV